MIYSDFYYRELKINLDESCDKESINKVSI